MKDPAVEIEVVRGDIDLLRSMIDRALDERTGDDIYLRALSDVLYMRQKRLYELQDITLYLSRPAEEPQQW